MEKLNGNESPNDSKKDEWFAEQFDKSINFDDLVKSVNETPIEPEPEPSEQVEDFSKLLKTMTHLQARKDFDFDTIFNFCQEHRVEILVQEDDMYHCFIDWHLPEGKGSWAIEFNALTSLVRGVTDYIKHKKLNEKPNDIQE